MCIVVAFLALSFLICWLQFRQKGIEVSPLVWLYRQFKGHCYNPWYSRKPPVPYLDNTRVQHLPFATRSSPGILPGKIGSASLDEFDEVLSFNLRFKRNPDGKLAKSWSRAGFRPRDVFTQSLGGNFKHGIRQNRLFDAPGLSAGLKAGEWPN